MFLGGWGVLVRWVFRIKKKCGGKLPHKEAGHKECGI